MMILAAAAKPVSRLLDLLNKSKDAYYNTDQYYKATADDVKGLGIKPGPITDSVFDKLEDLLREWSPNNPYFKKVGAPVREKDVKLPVAMPSLNKAKGAMVEAWSEANPGPYVESLKLDGTSLELVYKSGQQVKIYQRGDGIMGSDVSFLAPYLKIPQSLNQSLVVRSEAILSKAAFKAFEHEFANARNMVSGIFNKTSEIHKGVKAVDVIAYAQLLPVVKPSMGLKNLKRLGFKVVPYRVTEGPLVESELYEDLVELKKSHTHDIDGIVVVTDVPHKPPTENPSWSIAYKSNAADDSAQVTVVKVTWRVTRTGMLFPTIWIKPTKIGGVTVNKASGKSAKEIIYSGVGPGAILLVARSGDVIPDLREVIKKVKPQMPDVDYEWRGANLFVTNSKIHSSIVVGRLEHFFVSIGVERFKAASITPFVDAGFDTVHKILKMSKAKFVSMGSKTLEGVYEQMHNAVKEVRLPVLMAATGIFGRGFGVRRCTAILEDIPNVLELAPNKVAQQVQRIEGFDTKTATQFASNLEEFLDWLESTPEVSYTSTMQRKVSGPLNGVSVILTGFRERPLEEAIQKLGGSIASTVGQATVIIAKDPNGDSAKLKAGRSKRIPILTREQFINKYMKGSK